jgi:photosystem II stability/assembly factor-like uncharacterized protein
LFVFFLMTGLIGTTESIAQAQQAQKDIARLPVNLHGTFFHSQQEGWAVGQLGKIFYTANGGQSWQEQASGTNLLLTAVDFAEQSHGWVVGERGIILHSDDNGSSWTSQHSSTPYPLFDVDFTDQDTGWAVGHWGTIVSTRDGGKTWADHSLSLGLDKRGLIDPAAFHDVVDPSNGELVAKAGELLTTQHLAEIQRRGITDVHIREDVVLNTVFFFDQLHGWIGGEGGLVLFTENGGETWERTTLPRLPLPDEEASDIEYTAEELEAFGIVTPPPSVYGLFFTSALQGWAVGQDGALMLTQDGGRQWEIQASAIRESLYDVGVTGERGWAVGDKGTILQSSDGGKQWKTVELGLEFRFFWLRRLSVIPGDHAFLVGADGLVLNSETLADQARRP